MKYSNKKVALIDDDKMNITVTTKFLGRYGIVPDIGYSAAELFEKLKNNEYDLILLDNMMPNMEGIEATKILRGKQQHEIYNGDIYTKPIVVLTGDTPPPQAFIDAGFDDYLAKPLQIAELERVLNKFLN